MEEEIDTLKKPSPNQVSGSQPCHSGRPPTWRNVWARFGPEKNHRLEFRSRPGIHAGI